jgi:hypothetical protein
MVGHVVLVAVFCRDSLTNTSFTFGQISMMFLFDFIGEQDSSS